MGTGFQTERIKLEISCFTYFSQPTPHYLLSCFLPNLLTGILAEDQQHQQMAAGRKYEREQEFPIWSCIKLASTAVSAGKS